MAIGALGDRLVRVARERFESDERALLSLVAAAPLFLVVLAVVWLLGGGGYGWLAALAVVGLEYLTLRGRPREEAFLLYWIQSWIFAVLAILAAVAAGIDVSLGAAEERRDVAALCLAAAGASLAVLNVVIAQIYVRLTRIEGGR